MKILLLLLPLLCLASLSFSQENHFEKGNEAYKLELFDQAIFEYNKAISEEKVSAALYYNLGNAYYKTREIGESIWAYEKALKINPDDRNAKANLIFLNKKTIDKIEVSSSEMGAWLKVNLFKFTVNFWSILSIVSSILLSIFLYFFFTTNNRKIKSTSLILSILFVFSATLFIVFAYFHKTTITDISKAIIISPIIEVKATPSDSANTTFELHEGTKVSIERANETWVEITVNQNTGWVQKTDIWTI